MIHIRSEMITTLYVQYYSEFLMLQFTKTAFENNKLDIYDCSTAQIIMIK